MLLIRVPMDVRSIIRAALCGALVLSCSEAEPEPDVSAPAPAAAEFEVGWPETIVAERGRFTPEGVEYDQTHGRILVGSLVDGSVYQLERDGRLTPVVEDPELVSGVAPYEVMATTVAVVGDDLYVVHPHFQDDGEPSVERVEFE